MRRARPRRGGPLGRALGRLALLLAGAAVGLLLAEGLARLLRPAAGAELLFGAPALVPAGLFAAQPGEGMAPTPGFVGHYRAPDVDVALRFDGLGLRGAPPGPGPRWLALGDSFVLALQVEEEEAFPNRLGALRGVQVLNAGVDGTAPPQALQRLRRLLGPTAPARVLLVVFVGNDLTEARQPTAGAVPPPPSAPAGALVRLLLPRSLAFAHARVAVARARLAAGLDPGLRRHQEELRLFLRRHGHDRLQPAVRDLLPSILAIQEEAHRAGAALSVAVAPPSFAMDPARAAATFALLGLPSEDLDVDAPARALESALGAAGLAPCGLTAALRASHAAGRPPYLRFDGHWNAVGHAVVAEALDACIPR